MHPILTEILARPVGWLAIGGSILMVGIALGVFLFVRRQVLKEERGGK
jgi:protein-S-isoprenylcysteine O-methyltransferase Ste14